MNWTDDDINDRLKLALSIGDIGRADILRELQKNRAALERARALASTWAAKQYNGDLTAAVYNGCADELAAALSPDGAR